MSKRNPRPKAISNRYHRPKAFSKRNPSPKPIFKRNPRPKPISKRNPSPKFISITFPGQALIKSKIKRYNYFYSISFSILNWSYLKDIVYLNRLIVFSTAMPSFIQ